MTERQPRERPVPCAYCRRMTWQVSAVCDRCTDEHAADQAKRDDHLLTVRLERETC